VVWGCVSNDLRAGSGTNFLQTWVDLEWHLVTCKLCW